MKDGQGRDISYMRISITDRCNLRCKYCMPRGARTAPKSEILTLEEIRAVARCSAKLGIRSLKVTGGEPLVRRDCCRLIGMLKEIPGIERVTLTTNGALLEPLLDSLQEAGIDGINISLDTVDRRRYEAITGQDCLEQVLEGLYGCVRRGIPVKINAVALDLEEESWRGILELARELPVDVRFIELMPMGMGKQLTSPDPDRILKQAAARYPGIRPDDRFHGPGPAVYYKIPGFQGSLGFINAIHGKFCAGCNRIRLTARGYLKTCLCYEDGVDLRAILRQEGAESKEERLLEAMREAILKKPAAHCFEHPQDMTEKEGMSSIGG